MIERPLRSEYQKLEDYVDALESYVIHLERQQANDQAKTEKAVDQVVRIMRELENSSAAIIN